MADYRAAWLIGSIFGMPQQTVTCDGVPVLSNGSNYYLYDADFSLSLVDLIRGMMITAGIVGAIAGLQRNGLVELGDHFAGAEIAEIAAFLGRTRILRLFGRDLGEIAALGDVGVRDRPVEAGAFVRLEPEGVVRHAQRHPAPGRRVGAGLIDPTQTARPRDASLPIGVMN